MSLAEALKRDGIPTKGPRCTVCTLLEVLSKEDCKALRRPA